METTVSPEDIIAADVWVLIIQYLSANDNRSLIQTNSFFPFLFYQRNLIPRTISGQRLNWDQIDSIERILKNERQKQYYQIGIKGELGSGKTVTILSVAAKSEKKRTLIVTPASVVAVWKIELEKFFPQSSSFRWLIFHCSSEKKIDQFTTEQLDQYDLIVVSANFFNSLYNKEKEIKDAVAKTFAAEKSYFDDRQRLLEKYKEVTTFDMDFENQSAELKLQLIDCKPSLRNLLNGKKFERIVFDEVEQITSFRKILWSFHVLSIPFWYAMSATPEKKGNFDVWFEIHGSGYLGRKSTQTLRLHLKAPPKNSLIEDVSFEFWPKKYNQMHLLNLQKSKNNKRKLETDNQNISEEEKLIIKAEKKSDKKQTIYYRYICFDSQKLKDLIYDYHLSQNPYHTERLDNEEYFFVFEDMFFKTKKWKFLKKLIQLDLSPLQYLSKHSKEKINPKTIIWIHNTKIVELIKKESKLKKWKNICFMITNQSSSTNLNNFQKFQNSEQKTFLFISAYTHIKGWNFQFAHQMIAVETVQDRSVFAQLLGRLNRYGQDNQIHFFPMVYKDTFEEITWANTIKTANQSDSHFLSPIDSVDIN